MNSINSVCISGRLVRDAEFRATRSGSVVALFSVAVSESRKQASGDYEDYASFIDCVGYGKLYESLKDRLVKGAEVIVQGTIYQSRWEGDSGTRSKVEIHLGFGSKIRVLGCEKTAKKEENHSDVYDYDIPF